MTSVFRPRTATLTVSMPGEDLGYGDVLEASGHTGTSSWQEHRIGNPTRSNYEIAIKVLTALCTGGSM